jgi:inorganic pyrophosphatase
MDEILKARDSAGPAEPLTSVVEIPKDSRSKYEYDAELGAIRLDRSLDGDALDVLACVSEPTFPGCVVLARPIALLETEDKHGVDPHVLSVPIADPGWNQLERFEDLPTQLVAEIGHFFAEEAIDRLWLARPRGRSARDRGVAPTLPRSTMAWT